MRVLLIGDPSGEDDEGMKKTSRKLAHYLNRSSQADARLVSVAEAVRRDRRLGADIVHYMAGPSWRSVLYCEAVKRLSSSKPKSVLTFIHPHWSLFAGACFRLLAPDAAFVQSARWEKYCVERNCRTFNTPMSGIDPERFRPVSPERKSSMRAGLDVSEKSRLLLHVGHLTKGRNLSILSELAQRPSTVVTLIVSTTGIPEKSIAESLRNAGVRVVRQYVERIETYYQAADCYVFPTTNPLNCVQLPLSVLEALACGTPVVSTNFEGIPYYLKSIRGLFRASSVDHIPPLVERALSASVKVDADRLSSFHWNRIAQAAIGCYRELLRA